VKRTARWDIFWLDVCVFIIACDAQVGKLPSVSHSKTLLFALSIDKFCFPELKIRQEIGLL